MPTDSKPGPYTCANCGAGTGSTGVASRTGDGDCTWCARGLGPSVPVYPQHVKRPGWPESGPSAATPGHP